MKKKDGDVLFVCSSYLSYRKGRARRVVDPGSTKRVYANVWLSKRIVLLDWLDWS